MITIYTDGSSKGNPGPGGWGVIVLESWEHNDDDAILIDVHAESIKHTTNNREEMKAIIWALRNYGDKSHRGNGFLIPIVYSDSSYCVNSFTSWIKGWKNRGWKRAGNKPLENLDLILEYDELCQMGYKIDLRKIPGHSGIKWNIVADKLATCKITPEEVKIKYGR